MLIAFLINLQNTTNPPKNATMKKILSSSIAACGALFCTFAALPNLQAGLILQADFNGTGTGTGGVNDLVTSGGTGALNSYNGAVTSVPSAPTLGQGSFLNVNGTAIGTNNGNLGGVTITPASSANSFAALNTVSSGTVKLHGAVDFFFRPDAIAGGNFNIIDVGGPSSGGRIRLILTLSPTMTRFNLSSGGAGTEGFLTGTSSSGTSSYTTPTAGLFADATGTNGALVAGTTYHYGFTLSTDAGDVSTMSLYRRSDTLAIDTTSIVDRVATQNFKINGANVTVGLTGGNFDFNLGGNSNSADAKGRINSGDKLSLYDAVPTSFSSIPEPGTVSLVGIGLLGLLAVRNRKKLLA